MTPPADGEVTLSGLRPAACSLDQARPGVMLRVRELAAPAEMAVRLRELGFCERQRVRLLSKHTNIICQVCNARLGISRDLASMILVEPVRPQGESRPHE